MSSLTDAYMLADEYTSKTKGYTSIRTARWNHNIEGARPEIEYTLSAQALEKPEVFTSGMALINRLQELLA